MHFAVSRSWFAVHENSDLASVGLIFLNCTITEDMETVSVLDIGHLHLHTDDAKDSESNV